MSLIKHILKLMVSQEDSLERGKSVKGNSEIADAAKSDMKLVGHSATKHLMTSPEGNNEFCFPARI